MAIVKGPLQVTGSVSGVSFYTRRGSDQVIMRSKGGVSGDKIKRKPQFEGFRRQQKEWSGCTKLGSGVRNAFGGLHRLADYNLSSALNGLANKLQKADTEGEKGRRPVRLSTGTQALEGFNFNRQYLFNSVVRVSTAWNLDREHLAATVNFPRVNTEVDLLNVQRLPYFRLIAALGTASDMLYSETLSDYVPAVSKLHGSFVVANTDWFPTSGVVAPQTLELNMTQKQQEILTPEVSVILSVAVEFGTVGYDGKPVEVKYAGCGKVVGVG